ncbi:Uncharacterised protein [Yersinia kristensenii]|nr:Uncharacterised protein [Yersinia kristensenii]
MKFLIKLISFFLLYYTVLCSQILNLKTSVKKMAAP